MLTEERKRLREKTANSNLKMYPKYDRSFANIVTGDETWVHFYELKQKHENKIWATKHMKRPRIAKRTMSVKYKNVGHVRNVLYKSRACRVLQRGGS